MCGEIDMVEDATAYLMSYTGTHLDGFMADMLKTMPAPPKP
jgi:hypothetical protein